MMVHLAMSSLINDQSSAKQGKDDQAEDAAQLDRSSFLSLDGRQLALPQKGGIMEPEDSQIVDIPENRVKYFGCSGKMLLPGPATVAGLIEHIPEHQLLTTDLLRKMLTEQFKVQGTCPVTTRKSLQTVAHDGSKQVAYWRVINANGTLIAHFPGGVEEQAALLRKEGFTIDTHRKIPKVLAFTNSLAHLE